MSRDLEVIGLNVIKGEIVPEAAVLDARAMCSMNFARLEHQRLDRLIRTFVIPMIGGYQTELSEALDRHLEQIQTFSGNYCVKHRHIGAAWGEVGKRPGDEECEQ